MAALNLVFCGAGFAKSVWGKEPDYVTAGLNAAGFAGSAMALLGSSWAGPVGWTIALVSMVTSEVYGSIKQANQNTEAAENILKGPSLERARPVRSVCGLRRHAIRAAERPGRRARRYRS